MRRIPGNEARFTWRYRSEVAETAAWPLVLAHEVPSSLRTSESHLSTRVERCNMVFRRCQHRSPRVRESNVANPPKGNCFIPPGLTECTGADKL